MEYKLPVEIGTVIEAEYKGMADDEEGNSFAILTSGVGLHKVSLAHTNVILDFREVRVDTKFSLVVLDITNITEIKVALYLDLSKIQ